MSNIGHINFKGGAAPANKTVVLKNRTGGALQKGDKVALNLEFAATSGQAMAGTNPNNNDDGAGGWVYGAAIGVTAANACYKVAWLQDDTCADNGTGNFMIQGIGYVCAESGVAKGDFLTSYTAAAASAVGVRGATAAGTVTGYTRAELDAFQAVVGIEGVALEDAGSETIILAEVDGEVWKHLYGGGA